MKNITIVTWAGVRNYGTSLQSYALQHALELKGYHVCISDRFFLKSNTKYFFFEVKKILMDILNHTRSKAIDNRALFHEKFQNIVKPNTHSELKAIVDKTDVFISGSDQIWNTAHRYDPAMFLDFAEGKKRISYASSIGTNQIPSEYKDRVREHLMKYKYIAVRENSAVDEISKLTGRDDIKQVVDPTFLLNEGDWSDFANFANLSFELPKYYIFCYFIADNNYYVRQLKDIKEKYGIDNVILIKLRPDSSLQITGALTPKNIGPNEFVSLIRNAKLVCTDSFHATAIAINLKVDFVDLLRFADSDKASQNSRIYDLLSHYQLEYKLYSEKSDNWQMIPAYNSVHKILDEDRIYSWNYLLTAIEN